MADSYGGSGNIKAARNAAEQNTSGVFA